MLWVRDDRARASLSYHGRVHKHLPRLNPREYIGQRAVAFTACLEGRRPFFQSSDSVEPQVQLLIDIAANYRLHIPIYCFMPDHLHLILSGNDEASNSLEAFRKYKLRSGILLQKHNGIKWQRQFYDHIIRASEDWRRQATYIAMNPVRAGLVESLFDYPYLGSVGCDLQDVVFGY